MSNQGMYRVITKITFVQQPNADFPGRNRTLTYNFANSYECEDTWRSMTDTCKITIPKNVFVRDANGQLVNLSGTTVNIGGFGNNAPLFMRGDQVTVEAGYRFYDAAGNEKTLMSTWFNGYVRTVGSKKPITLDCEDNMFKLKTILAPNKTYSATTTMESIIAELMAGTGFTVNVLTKTTLGEFSTHNETVAEVLGRLQKEYHFYPYFRGNELRIGSQVYIEQDALDSGKKVFRFQRNIISDDLQYTRTDDLELSAVAYSVNKIELAGLGTTRAGKKRTRHKRLEALVTIRNGRTTSYVRPDNSLAADFAPNVNGERRTLYFWNVQTSAELIALAEAELKKYYYQGMKGKFVTFGIPFIQSGDNVDIMDDVLPERNGRYKVRSVKYSGGVDGLRQEIELDYLITRLNNRGDAIK
jgi:hypothetical protein